MFEADKLFMKRALELARRGAGLVSPNPMVGAVLVKEGRIVGEGYHRYDLLKHGETYAMEMAGAEAQGSTLYCNLEPCCHYGRTPPCSDAVIKAGIARALIAIKDPFPRVNGRGIEQLRTAGIDVEVGLCDDEALRLNESYFKFVARNTPFVHGVIEYPAEGSESPVSWKPSRGFIESASEYDAVVLGSRAELNSRLIEQRLSRTHHRPLVVVGGAGTLELAMADERGEPVFPDGVAAKPGSAPVAGVTDASEALRTLNPMSVGSTELTSMLESLARASVTSVVILPGAFDLTEPNNFEQIDKLTLAVAGAKTGDTTATRLGIADLEFDLEEVSIAEADGYTEFTGYPRLRGVA
ncbi:MAG: bifunctional diaminohydroxyphosphoribosylaminopyrimidine deaminase/5-amino-6-(5-phosphoribosylamino)uracil reductase RibD [Blastocatellia bacterium]